MSHLLMTCPSASTSPTGPPSLSTLHRALYGQLTSHKSTSRPFIKSSNTKHNMAESIHRTLTPPSLMVRKFMRWAGTIPPPVPKEDRPFEPKWFFFYGTLTNPETLAQILNRSENPELPHAKVFGPTILYWGEYPAAILGVAEQPIDGVVCKIESQEELDRLETYETKMYRVDGCTAWLDDDTEVLGFLFVWDDDMSLLRESSGKA